MADAVKESESIRDVDIRVYVNIIRYSNNRPKVLLLSRSFE